jgi:Tfp pilus assembly major pilin PilA
MKKTLTLVEVLISVMLISIIVVALLQIEQNNLYLLEKTKDMTKYNSYISLVALENDDKNLRNKSFYLDKKIDFKDDDIRRELKEIKVNIKDKKLKPIIFEADEYSLNINIKQTQVSIKDDAKKVFYWFSLGEDE